MRYDLILSQEAVDDLRGLDAHDRAVVRDALEVHLRFEPTKTSKSRIKRLRGMAQPQYRLRVGDVRVFYDVVGAEVRILAVVAKSQAERWLQKAGTPDEENRPL